MYHDLFQICRGAGKSCCKRRVLRTDERIQFTLVAARADEFSAQRCAAGGVRSLYRQICAGQRLLFFADGDAAILDISDRVGAGVEIGCDVRGEEDRYVLLLAERQECVQQFIARNGIEAGRRLVENQQFCLV